MTIQLNKKNKRTGGIVLICILLILVFFSGICALTPDRIVFVRIDRKTFPAGESRKAFRKEIAERLENGFAASRDSAAARLNGLADFSRLSAPEAAAFDSATQASLFSDCIRIDASGCGLQNAVHRVREIFGKKNDIVLDIQRTNDSIGYTANRNGKTILENRVPVVQRNEAENGLAEALYQRLVPAASLLADYPLSSRDAYMDKIYRMRIYESSRSEPAVSAFAERWNRSCRSGNDLVRGVVCESFGYTTSDTAALNEAIAFYRDVRADGLLAETLGDRIRKMEAFIASSPQHDDAFVRSFLDENIQLPDSCRQLLLVYNDRPERVSCVFRRYEKIDGLWRQAAYPIRSGVGRAGIAPSGEKREGDGRTPAGAFPMGFAFGYDKDIELAWPFLVVTKQHFWISDPDDPLYNQMTMETPRTSNFEYLRRDDEVYRYAAVVEYNMRPIEKGKGSAIFFHIQSGFDRGSAGCITVTENKVVEILQWLDPQKAPYMLIETRSDGI